MEVFFGEATHRDMRGHQDSSLQARDLIVGSARPGADSTLPSAAIIVQAMPRVRRIPRPAKRFRRNRARLLLGAHVGLHSREATAL